MSDQARQKVRAWFQKAVDHRGAEPEDGWGCSEAELDAVRRLCGSGELPAAVEEFLRLCGGVDNPVMEMFAPASLLCGEVLSLQEYGSTLATKLGHDAPPWADALLLQTSPSGELMWITTGEPDPPVYGSQETLDDWGTWWPSFTAYLEDVLRIDVETRAPWVERESRLPEDLKKAPTVPPDVWETPTPESIRVALGSDHWERLEAQRRDLLEESHRRREQS